MRLSLADIRLMSDFLLSDKQFIINYLHKNDIFLKKKYGQNFVVDRMLLETVIGSSDLTSDDTVLEIGAGVGSLTERILAEGARVIAIEIDERFVSLLTTHFIHNQNFSLIHGDILKKDTIEKIREAILPNYQSFKVVANVPYYITSPIITTLLTCGLNISDMVFTVQKEVAQRLVAYPNCKEYSAISIFMRYYGDTNLLESFPPTSFFPSPRVWSSVIHFSAYTKRPFTAKNPLFFHHCVKLCFTERRKMIKNSISRLIKGWKIEPDMQLIEKMLAGLNVDPMMRPDQIPVEKFIDISDELWKIHPDTMKKKWLA